MNALIDIIVRLSETWWPWTLDVTLQGLAAAILLVPFIFWVKQWPAAWRHLLLLVVLIKFAVPWPFGFDLPLLPSETAPAITSAIISEIPEETITSIEIPPSMTYDATVAIQDKPVIATPGLSWSEIGFLLWFAGLLVYSIRTAWSVFSVYTLVRQSPLDPKLTEYASAISADLGLKRKIPVRLSMGNHPPSVVGILKPCILLPSGGESYDLSQLRLLLCHELAHIRRRDHLTNWLRAAIVIVNWWNPIVHYLNARIGEESERSCDDKVLNLHPGQEKIYGQLLIDTTENVSQHYAFAALTFSEPRFALARRIKRIALHATAAVSPLRPRTYVVFAIIFSLLLPAWSMVASSPKDQTESLLEKTIDGPVLARGQSLNTILQLIHASTGVSIVLDEGINKKVTFNLESPSIRDILDTVLPANGLEYAVLPNHVIRIFEREKTALQETLPPDSVPELKKVINGPVLARDQDLQTLLHFIQSSAGIQFVLEGGISKKVTFNLENPSVKDVLDTVLPAYRLDYAVLPNHAIRIFESKKTLPKETLPLDSEPELKKVIDGPVIARVQNLLTILQLIQVSTGVSIVVDEGIDKKVTFNLESPSIRELLDTVLPSCSLDYAVLPNHAIRIFESGKTKVTESLPPDSVPELKKVIEGPIIAKDQNLLTILQLIQSAAGIKYVVDEGIEKKVTFNLENPTIRDILDTVLPACGLDYVILPNKAVRIIERKKVSQANPEETLPPDSIPELKKVIEGPIVMRDQDLTTILSLINQESGLRIVLDESMNKKVTCTLNSPTIKEILDTILPSVNLDYIVQKNGVIRIGRSDTIQDRHPQINSLNSVSGLNKVIEGKVEAKLKDPQAIVEFFKKTTGIPIDYQGENILGEISISLENPTGLELLQKIFPPSEYQLRVENNGELLVYKPADNRSPWRHYDAAQASNIIKNGTNGLYFDNKWDFSPSSEFRKIPPDSIPELNKVIEDPVVVRNQDILMLIAEKANIKFYLDKEIDNQLNQLKNCPEVFGSHTVREILDTILPPIGLTYSAINIFNEKGILLEKANKNETSESQPPSDENKFDRDDFSCYIDLDKFICPVKNPFTILRRFDMSSKPIHPGISVSAKFGTPIYAAADGTVDISGKETSLPGSNFGNHIILNHGKIKEDGPSIRTIYAHNSENLVKQGQKVKKGELIAKMGNSGNPPISKEAVLHFQCRALETPNDPTSLFTLRTESQKNILSKWKIEIVTQNMAIIKKYTGESFTVKKGDLMRDEVYGDFTIEELHPDPDSPRVKIKFKNSGSLSEITNQDSRR